MQLPRSVVNMAYRLSYHFLRNEEQTLEALRKAARRLGAAIARQDKRITSQAKKPTITNLEIDSLFLALVIDATDDIAAEQRCAGAMMLTPADYIRQFLLHAIRISRNHSLPLAIAVTRIIHSYQGNETKLLYEDILFGSVREGYGYREIKRKQMASLDLSFQGLFRTKDCPNNEERFEAMDSVGPLVDLARRTLKLLTVWGSDYAIPKRFVALMMELVEMQNGNDPDIVHLIDRRRMDTLTHPDHFGTLVAGVSGLKPAHKTYALPVVYLPHGPEPELTEDMYEDKEPPMPDERALREIENIPAEQDALRQRWATGPVTLHVNGLDRGSITPGCRYIFPSHHAGFVTTVEIWGECDGVAVLLDAVTFNLIDESEGDLRARMLLAYGCDFSLHAKVGGTDAAPVLTFRVAYDITLDDADKNADGESRSNHANNTDSVRQPRVFELIRKVTAVGGIAPIGLAATTLTAFLFLASVLKSPQPKSANSSRNRPQNSLILLTPNKPRPDQASVEQKPATIQAFDRPSQAALADSEMRVRYKLFIQGWDVGEDFPIERTRQDVLVSGTASSALRAADISAVLGGIPYLRIAIKSPRAEAVPSGAAIKTTSNASDQRPLLNEVLDSTFQSADARYQFVVGLLNDSDAIKARAIVVDKLAHRYSAAELRLLSSEQRDQLREIVLTHLDKLNAANASLSPLADLLHDNHDDVVVATQDWRTAATSLLDEARIQDHLLIGLVVSTAPDLPSLPIASQAFQNSRRNLERLITDLVQAVRSLDADRLDVDETASRSR